MIETILERLRNVSKAGKGFKACCPSHEDRSPSLALLETSDGRILIHCFAGCSPQDVLAAIGLSMSDLFPDGQLGEYRGFVRIQEDIKGRRRDVLGLERMVLKMAQSDRSSGKRLSQEDLARERQAFERMRHAATD